MSHKGVWSEACRIMKMWAVIYVEIWVNFSQRELLTLQELD